MFNSTGPFYRHYGRKVFFNLSRLIWSWCNVCQQSADNFFRTMLTWPWAPWWPSAGSTCARSPCTPGSTPPTPRPSRWEFRRHRLRRQCRLRRRRRRRVSFKKRRHRQLRQCKFDKKDDLHIFLDLSMNDVRRPRFLARFKNSRF